MNIGDLLGSLTVGLDFAIWSPLNIGANAYDGCDKFPDGTVCLLGTSCNNCANQATYWYGAAISKCGIEPKYVDGTTCLVGLSCNNCQNPSTYWVGPPSAAMNLSTQVAQRARQVALPSALFAKILPQLGTFLPPLPSAVTNLSPQMARHLCFMARAMLV